MKIALISFVLIGVVCSSLFAQNFVESDPVGYIEVNALGNSDTRLSVPFARPAVFSGAVSSINTNVITVQGIPGWSANEFVYASGSQPNTYYLQFKGGPQEGRYYTVTANGSATLTLNLNGGNLTGVEENTHFALIPYWTLGTVFPVDNPGVHVSAAPTIRNSEILVPNTTGTGTNLGFNGKTYYFWNGAWRQVGQGTAVKNDEVLMPDTYVVIRNNISTGTTKSVSGDVSLSKVAIPLRIHTSLKQDNMIALTRPKAISLSDSELISSGAFIASPSPTSRTDELLVYDDSIAGKNKAALYTYYYWNNAWRRVGAGATDVGNHLIFTPGTGVIIRKNPHPSQQLAVWTHNLELPTQEE